MKADPQKEHEWLQQLVGEWTYEHEATMGPGQPPARFTGRERVRSLGGLWVVCEGEGEMPGGGTATVIMTLGYDPERKRYTGTFIGSMMTHLWVYDGELDAGGKALILSTDGPNFTGDGKIVKYNDIVEIKSRDHRTLRSRVLGDDGQWVDIMTANYRRVR
jgi:hypothetical protein